jgi:phage gp46-like protein
MPQDIKLFQDSDGLFDIDFQNGDFALTDGLDSALYMSTFYKQRATASQVSVPEYREGHFTDIFNEDINYQIGCYLWLYTKQSRLDDRILSLVEDTIINDGLQWLIDDNIVRNVNVEAVQNGSTILLRVGFDNEDQQNSNYYQAFINTFS